MSIISKPSVNSIRESQSGNAPFGSKLVIFCPVWPWNLTDDLEKQQDTSSMLLQVLCIISWPSVNSNWSYSPETPNMGQNRRPWNLSDELERQWQTSAMLLQAVCMISLPYVNSNWNYSPGTAKLGFDVCDIDLWPLTMTFCMDITSVNNNNSWKFHDDENI